MIKTFSPEKYFCGSQRKEQIGLSRDAHKNNARMCNNKNVP